MLDILEALLVVATREKKKSRTSFTVRAPLEKKYKKKKDASFRKFWKRRASQFIDRICIENREMESFYEVRDCSFQAPLLLLFNIVSI